MPDNSIRHIFFDLDNTLWDFNSNSKTIIQKLYFDFDLPGRGITDFDIFYNSYKQRNELLWEAYRFGVKNREEVRFERFYVTLHDHGITNKKIAMEMADYYVQNTKHLKELLPGAIDTLQYLNVKYALHVITNGFDEVQLFKIQNCGLQHFFKTITTAESAGSLKPDKKIFEVALQEANAHARQSMYIGDSPQTDGMGAINVGMQFILIAPDNRQHIPDNMVTISSLMQLQEIL